MSQLADHFLVVKLICCAIFSPCSSPPAHCSAVMTDEKNAPTAPGGDVPLPPGVPGMGAFDFSSIQSVLNVRAHCILLTRIIAKRESALHMMSARHAHRRVVQIKKVPILAHHTGPKHHADGTADCPGSLVSRNDAKATGKHAGFARRCSRCSRCRGW